MNVSSQNIIKRMEVELIEAKSQINDRKQLLKKVANIKLLCELLLDEAESKTSTTDERKVAARIVKTEDDHTIDVEHHPSSIFDF